MAKLHNPPHKNVEMQSLQKNPNSHKNAERSHNFPPRLTLQMQRDQLHANADYHFLTPLSCIYMLTGAEKTMSITKIGIRSRWIQWIYLLI